jgi:acetylornithine deacetylase/succinyl-diaminopimelate desuccinylase-like protein
MVSVTNLVVRERFGSGKGPTIALNAHGDVVPPGQGWSHDPYGAEEQAGAIYGRGAAVSKSDFANYGFALLALKDNPTGLDGTVELHLTYDEESGGFLGPEWLLNEGISKPDLAISAGFSYAVVTAHNGVLHLEVTVKGRQAHAALPESGADALQAATGVLNALYAERRRLAKRKSKQPGIGTPKLTVGLISGGINTNVVPDRIVMRLDRRLIPEENGVKVEKALIARIKRAAKGKGISVGCRRVILAEPLKPIAGIERLVEPLTRHGKRELKAKIAVKGVPLYTDARHYSAAGIPTVLYGAGPRSILEANAHSADEHIKLSDLKAATRVIEAMLRDVLASK